MKVAERLPLTAECHHYANIGDVPWDIQKYWQQRYSIFSWYDYDIQLTDDAWFGVTPEPVATKVAEDLATCAKPSATTLVDLFAGAGGNVIAFALSDRWEKIIAIEKDAATLACAQHNAEVYEVGHLITWVHGDSFEYLEKLKTAPESLDEELRIDTAVTEIFASPPWGGVGYRDHDIFDLNGMQPYNLAKLYEASSPLAHALYLPRTSDLRQIAKLAPEGQKIDVVQYCMEGASKAMVAYIPSSQQLP